MKNAMQLKAIMKKLAKENQISAQLVLQNYMLERFLERVSLSPYRDNYIIKGGFLISSIQTFLQALFSFVVVAGGILSA